MKKQKVVSLCYLALAIVLVCLTLAAFGDKIVWVCLPFTDE